MNNRNMLIRNIIDAARPVTNAQIARAGVACVEAHERCHSLTADLLRLEAGGAPPEAVREARAHVREAVYEVARAEIVFTEIRGELPGFFLAKGEIGVSDPRAPEGWTTALPEDLAKGFYRLREGIRM